MSKRVKKKMGRPTKYNVNYHPLLVESLARNGFTDKEISEKIGISEKTLNNWKNKYPDFLQSLKRGKEHIVGKLEHALYESALGYEVKEEEGYIDKESGEYVTKTVKFKHVAKNVTAQIFALKNLAPERWREKQQIDHTIDEATADIIASILSKKDKDIKE